MASIKIILYVNGVVVQSTDPLVSSTRTDVECSTLSRNYESPAELVFHVKRWYAPEFIGDVVVRLYLDGILEFDGVTTLPRMALSATGIPMMEYRAIDRGGIYRTALDVTLSTSFFLPNGTLRSTVDLVAPGNAASLTQMGLNNPAIYIGGADLVPFVQTTIESMSVDQMLRRIAAQCPGVRCFVDPNGGVPSYCFVNLFAAPNATITLEQQIADQIVIERSLEGRAGAIRTNSRQAQASGGYIMDPNPLVPAWSGALQSIWTLNNATTTDVNNVTPGISDVFRKWSFANLPTGTPPASSKLVVQALTRGFDNNGIPADIWLDTPIVPDSVDFGARTLKTVYPILGRVSRPGSGHRRDPMMPGQAIAGQCRLKYQQTAGGYVTLQGTRYPLSGFAGTVMALAPTSMAYEKQIEVPFGVPFEYSQYAWSVFSEPIVRGSLTLKAPLPDDFYRLRRRVSFASTTHSPTGYESLNAPLMGIAMDLAQNPPSLTMDFSTERTTPGGG